MLRQLRLQEQQIAILKQDRDNYRQKLSERKKVNGLHSRTSFMPSGTNAIKENSKRKDRSISGCIKYLAHLLADTDLGMWTREPQNGKITLYKNWSALFGFEHLNMQTDELFLQKRIHPDDRPGFINDLNSICLGSADNYDAEYRIRDHFGKWRRVKEIGISFERSDEGHPLFISGVTIDISNQIKANKFDPNSDLSYRKYFSRSPEGAFLFDQSGRFLEVNDAVSRITGYPANHLLSSLFSDLIADENVSQGTEQFSRLFETGHASGEIVLKNFDGRNVHVGLEAVRLSENRFLGYFKDVSEQKETIEEMHKLEEQLGQSQKMEAIGRLAGGVAHDFNNLLTAITGYAEIVHDTLKVEDSLRADIEEIQSAADKASSLTQQLLAFSRKQDIKPAAIVLNNQIEESKKMLSRLIGEDIQLIFNPGPNLWKVKADLHQIDRVLVNLAVNSRDAMKKGGVLTISTSNETLDYNCSNIHPELVPGDYVRLSVKDTGSGIPQQIQNMIFEPFFTTKGKGEGTGLGLSTVYGIIKQSNGVIRIKSEKNKGTDFHIYLPRYICGEKETAVKDDKISRNGSETILLVEDENSVRSLMRKILRIKGYHVLEAPDADTAINLFNQYHNRIQLLMTDVIMPKMSGVELSKRLRQLKPDLKILFISGYSEKVFKKLDLAENLGCFLPKPFSMDILTRKLRSVLDQPVRQ